MEAILDRSGRIVIPKSVRKRLGLEPGDALTMEEDGGKLTLTPAREGEATALEGTVLVHQGRVTGDLEDAMGRTRDHGSAFRER